MNLQDRRREYARAKLDEGTAEPDPLHQFRRWYGEAEAAELGDANAMTLATATSDGRPSARIVLLKAYDEAGFVFFTDYRSTKSQDLAANPVATLLFFWRELERQVRILGRVGRLSPEASAEYFGTRPRGAQIGAWASHQSHVLEGGRAELERRVREVETRYPDAIPLPDHWGGFVLAPGEYEFWQGRENRLHDRLRYVRGDGSAGWRIDRLSP